MTEGVRLSGQHLNQFVVPVPNRAGDEEHINQEPKGRDQKDKEPDAKPAQGSSDQR
jgi:hypothetical protein